MPVEAFRRFERPSCRYFKLYRQSHDSRSSRGRRFTVASASHARRLIEDWRHEYNTERLHSSRG
ncbi:integrase core domain-containing protein [Paraburkholderia sp. J69-1]|uniref:integrase core domain-containing protein n=1 Tax=unclassified Paraburkholderia TaxID=2615204 RepID=UPI0039F14309